MIFLGIIPYNTPVYIFWCKTFFSLARNIHWVGEGWREGMFFSLVNAVLLFFPLFRKQREEKKYQEKKGNTEPFPSAFG